MNEKYPSQIIKDIKEDLKNFKDLHIYNEFQIAKKKKLPFFIIYAKDIPVNLRLFFERQLIGCDVVKVIDVDINTKEDYDKIEEEVKKYLMEHKILGNDPDEVFTRDIENSNIFVAVVNYSYLYEFLLGLNMAKINKIKG